MFEGKTTRDTFHCANCGAETPYGHILCKDCAKKMKKSGTHFEMQSARGTDRMEHLQ